MKMVKQIVTLLNRCRTTRAASTDEHSLMAWQLTIQTEYAQQLQQNEEEYLRLLHDFRHHLLTMSSLATQIVSTKETAAIQQKLIAYLDSLAKNTKSVQALRSGTFCKNIAVDALLHYYYCIACDNGVKTEFGLLLPEDFTLSDMELCTILRNLLEHAMNTCLRQPEGKRSILVSTSQVGNLFLLLVENTYDGTYSEDKDRFCKSGRDEFSTMLESVRDILDRHDGTLDIYPFATRFRIGIALPTDF